MHNGNFKKYHIQVLGLVIGSLDYTPSVIIQQMVGESIFLYPKHADVRNLVLH